VNFFQTPTSFNNLSFCLVYKTPKYRWYVEGDNLLGSKYFMTQDFNQSLLNVANNRVFGRYLIVGFEFKINWGDKEKEYSRWGFAAGYMVKRVAQWRKNLREKH